MILGFRVQTFKGSNTMVWSNYGKGDGSILIRICQGLPSRNLLTVLLTDSMGCNCDKIFIKDDEKEVIYNAYLCAS